MSVERTAAAADLSVVIVSYNVRQLLVDCLVSVFAMSGGLDMDVIVVDNGSTDGSVEAVRQQFSQVRVLANTTNAGFPGANNQALPYCRGRAVLFLNPDTVMHEATLPGLCQALAPERGPAMAGLDLRNDDGSQQNGAHHLPTRTALLRTFVSHGSEAISVDLRSDGTPRAAQRVGWVSGAALAVNRAALAALVGMDEQLFWAEDLDLGLRASAAGIPVYFLPGLCVTHLSGRSGQQNLAVMLYCQHVSKVRVLDKHFGAAPAAALSAWFVVALAGKIVVRAFQGLAGGTRAESEQRMSGYAAALRFLLWRQEPAWMARPRPDLVEKETS